MNVAETFSGRDSMKRLKLFLLYVVAVGLLALWMFGGLDPMVRK